MGIYGAALATILGLALSFTTGIYYFICKHKFLSFALLLLFLTVLPRIFGLTGVWLAVPAAEALTLLVSVWFLRPIQPQRGRIVP